MSDVAIFNNPEFGELRVAIGPDEEPWFVAADVCAALKHSNSRMALAGLDDDEKGVSKVYTLGGEQEMNIISEAGLYSLVLRSNLPEAKSFKRWVTHDVLPSIRKRGLYATPEVAEAIMKDPDTLIRILTDLKQERLARAEAEELAQKEADRAEYYRKTKAEIGSRREATSMATASSAVRRVKDLEGRLRFDWEFWRVQDIDWLSQEFVISPSLWAQVEKKLSWLSRWMGYPVSKAADERFPSGTRTYHISVIDAFRSRLLCDPNMLRRFRQR